jgi:hypothetical protein
MAKNKHGNISKYKKAKILATMTKGNGTISFISLDEDDWLIDVVKHKTKSGCIIESNTIIAKDMDRWQEIYSQEGYNI